MILSIPWSKLREQSKRLNSVVLLPIIPEAAPILFYWIGVIRSNIVYIIHGQWLEKLSVFFFMFLTEELKLISKVVE